MKVSQLLTSVLFLSITLLSGQSKVSIYDVQYTTDPGGASPYDGQTVEVVGIVTASSQAYDLGYVYIQDPDSTEWCGIWIAGTGLNGLERGEEVTVIGTVEEYWGMTRIVATSVVKTGVTGNVVPVIIDLSDSLVFTFGVWEKWESMLVVLVDPQSKIWISQPDLGFGDYGVSNVAQAAPNKSVKVMAGRQTSRYFSSLYVQLVSDSIYATNDGMMQVSPIEVDISMNMDALVGLVGYGYGDYRLHPRNNADFVGINVNLDTTGLGLHSYTSSLVSHFVAYPNPVSQTLFLEGTGQEPLKVEVLNLSGQILMEVQLTSSTKLELSGLLNGLYLLKVTDSKGGVVLNKIEVRH